MLVATIVSAAATTVVGAWSLPSEDVGWLGITGAGGGVTIGLVAFFAAFRFIGPVRATMLSNAEPVFGVLFAMAVLGERLDIIQWAGVAIVFVALVLFEASSVRRNELQQTG